MKKLYRRFLVKLWGIRYLYDGVNGYFDNDTLEYLMGFISAINQRGKYHDLYDKKLDKEQLKILKEDYIKGLNTIGYLLDNYSNNEIFIANYEFIIGFLPAVTHSYSSVDTCLKYFYDLIITDACKNFLLSLSVSEEDITNLVKLIDIFTILTSNKSSLEIVLDWESIEYFISKNPFKLPNHNR